jgi:hypothetical protein
MGKATPEPLIPQRTHSGRSYWVRNILASAREHTDSDATPKGVPRPPASQPTTKKRFVEPYRLTPEQRAAMLAPLAERGVGDPESRELFANALAYDLATCYERTVANPEPDPLAAPTAAETPAPTARQAQAKGRSRRVDQTEALESGLAELAKAAQGLAAQFDALHTKARSDLLHGLREGDRFRRGYDDGYLVALREELLRVAASIGGAATDEAASAAPPADRPTKQAVPKPSPAARQFIARAAGAFEECFDQAPTAQVGGPFTALLKALVSITGVRIPTDARSLGELIKHA